jgi:hypothetical protein
MATDAIVVLERLSCFREADENGHSEPYIWPALVWIDDLTLATPELVGVTSPALGSARMVLKGDMRAGETAAIPDTVGVLRVRLEDNLSVRRLMLAVALWEKDQTPNAAVEAGFRAFGSELRAALAANLFALAEATTTEERDPIIDEIERRVSNAVQTAIRSALTGWQKVQVVIGELDLDDIVGSAFHSFDELEPKSFSLSFVAGTAHSYALEGQLLSRPVPVDLCRAQAQDVQEAQALVDGIQAQIQVLQPQLDGGSGPIKAYCESSVWC